MAVGIGKISGIAAVVGATRRLQQRRALRDRKLQDRVDLFGRVAVPRQGHATKTLRAWIWRQGRVLGELIPREQADRGRAGVEEGHRLAGGVEFSRKAERLVEGDAGAHVGHAQRDEGETRDRRGSTHFTYSKRYIG